MVCLTQEVGPSQPTTCRVCRVPFQQGTHCEYGLEEGKDYFFVLVTPTDPNSFVSMSDNRCVVAQDGFAQGGFAQAIAAVRASNHPRFRSTPEQFCMLCPVGSPLIRCVLTYGLAALESPLDMLDLRAIDTDRLYKAGNSKNMQAFIGFMKGEPTHPEESRKRRRVD